MTKTRSTKKSLLLSCLALLLCFSMLIGTTFAWFTDSVTSNGNIIQTGTLNVEMYWAKGTEDPANATWKDASKGAIFNSKLWEPGYVEARHIKIANEGTLALNYQLRIVANGTVSKLADVIDVYYFENAAQMTRATATTGEHLGTLADILGTAKSLSKTVCGGLEAGTTDDLTLVLKMQETADNEYQNLSIGTDFSVELIATQMSFEKDSFGPDYDANLDSAVEPSVNIEVTPDNIDAVDFMQDHVTCSLKGEFASDVTLTVMEGLNWTYDASQATFADGVAVTVQAPGIAHSYDSLKAERKGSVTVKGFTVGTLNILAYNNEAVTVSNNTVAAMSVVGGNFALTIDGNKIDGDFGQYSDGENQSNEYGISLRITDYELSITNNEITDAYSHSIGINGRQGEAASDWGNCGANNQIVAFSGNTIHVNTTKKTQRAALKIWCDQVYAPYATSGQEPKEAAKQLMKDILADSTNQFILGAGHTTFNIFDYKA